MTNKLQAPNNSQTPKDLPALLAQIMATRGWSQAQLGEHLKMTPAAISKVRHSPSWNRHYRILTKLLEMVNQ